MYQDAIANVAEEHRWSAESNGYEIYKKRLNMCIYVFIYVYLCGALHKESLLNRHRG